MIYDRPAMTTGIELTAEAFNCLVAKLPKNSTLLEACRYVEIIHMPDEPVRFVLKCTDDEFQSLIKIAKEHCPQALAQLEAGLLKAAQNDSGNFRKGTARED
jgi:hypothetical protein